MGYQNEVRRDELTDAILARAVEVHTDLGSDHREQTYRQALRYALEDDEFEVAEEFDFSITFRGRNVGEGRADLVVEGEVVLELKAVQQTKEEHFQQLARTVRQLDVTRGLLLNFGAPTLDVRRYVDGYDPEPTER